MRSPEQIERIVREVIRRLNSGQHAGRQALARHAETRSVRSLAPVLNESGVLQVADRVITLSSITGKLGGIKQLFVSPKAVVTPSVRDELRKNNVQLVRRASSGGSIRTQLERKLLLANLGTQDLSGVFSELACVVQTIRQDSLQAAIGNMTNELSSNALGVIIVDQPELAVCLANRSSNVRAFVGHGVDSVRRAKMFEGNLMALDAASSSISTLLKSFLS